MGSKFANIQVFGGEVERVQALCPRHTALRLADGWVTVVSESIEWGSAQKVARELSKELPYAVMSVEYFDDDFVEFAVYTGGTRAARHRPTSYESYERKAGKPKDFAQIFGLGDGAEATLRKIFRETDAEESVRLLEALLGCVLWVDYDNYEAEYTPPGRGYIDEYFAKKAEERERARIKNRTKLVLVDEMGGVFEDGLFASGELISRDIDEPGRKTFWKISDDGLIVKNFELELPERAWSHIIDRYEDRLLININGYWQKGGTSALAMLSDAGEIVEIIPRSRESGVKLLGRERVFANGYCIDTHNHSYTWERRNSLWKYNVCSVHTLNEDRDVVMFAWGDLSDPNYEKSRVPYEFVLDVVDISTMGGSWLKRLVLPRPLFSVDVFTYKRRVYVHYRMEDSKTVTHLVCYDEELAEQWHIEIPHRGVRIKGVYVDETADRLYFTTSGEIVVVDLERQEVCARRELTETEANYTLDAVLPGIGLAMWGGSTFEIWDFDFNVISRHRDGGATTSHGGYRFLRRGDRSFVLLFIMPYGTSLKTVRVYEIKPLNRRK